VNILPKDLENQEGASSVQRFVLYSNVCSLCQAFGELSRVCALYRPLFVCLTETHLDKDPVDSFCPPGYVVAA